MSHKQLLNEIGNLVLIKPGNYLSEFRKDLNLPTFVLLKEESPGIILENFGNRKLVLVSDGDSVNKLFVNNISIQKLGAKNDNRLS